MITNDEVKEILNLLEELISINERLCSEEDMKLVKSFFNSGETELALDEFCGMWFTTNKPPLSKLSQEIIEKAAILSRIDLDTIMEKFSLCNNSAHKNKADQS